MPRRLNVLQASCTAVLLSGAAAMAQEACQSYTVKVGDNLRSIARLAYGDGDMYRVVYDANIAIIGPEADLIVIGAILAIPCNPNAPVVTAAAEPEPEALTTVVATAPEPAAEPPTPPAVEVLTPAAAAAPKATAGEKAISFVTGNGYAPFSDEMLAGGGMMTQLVEMAAFRADPSLPYTITFINDWQAHIDALLPSGAYDLSFPWARPNCDAPETLTAGDLSRCDSFVFSDPLFEIVEGFYMTRDGGLAEAARYDALFGKRVCRPEARTTGVLDGVGLTGGAVELMRPVTADECFLALVQGKTDLVSMDVDAADAAIARLQLGATVVQNPQLATIQTLHVIAHKSNERAVKVVEMLNEGVTEMYLSGEWYDIVSTALAQGRQ
jgi:ABC-type amino acid transport substrate-binding protein